MRDLSIHLLNVSAGKDNKLHSFTHITILLGYIFSVGVFREQSTRVTGVHNFLADQVGSIDSSGLSLNCGY